MSQSDDTLGGDVGFLAGRSEITVIADGGADVDLGALTTGAFSDQGTTGTNHVPPTERAAQPARHRDDGEDCCGRV